MVKAVFPGTFDPTTKGHLDIINRASKIIDDLTVLIVYNSAKKTLFTPEERLGHLKHLTSGYKNVKVDSWDGLTAEYAGKNSANIIIRGLRNGTDFDYELMIAEANKKIAPSIETLFISTAPEFSYLSSTIVKEISSYGGNIDCMVDNYIRQELNRKRHN